MSAAGTGVTFKQDALIAQIKLMKIDLIRKYGPSIQQRWKENAKRQSQSL